MTAPGHSISTIFTEFITTGVFGRSLGAARGVDDLINHVHAFDHLPEDGVMVVEPIRGRHGDKELRAVGAGAGVGHGEAARAVKRKVVA